MRTAKSFMKAEENIKLWVRKEIKIMMIYLKDV
jgi:hypothetical protein